MRKPNIVVIMADQLKASALGIYGNRACPTPSLSRLAAEGTTYEHTYTPHPLCVPARVAFWTGRYPHQTGCRRNETLMSPGDDHAFRHWHGAGYYCGLIGKNHCFQEEEFNELFDTWLELGHFGLVNNGWKKGEWCVDTAPLSAAHAAMSASFSGPNRHLSVHTCDGPAEAHTSGLIGTQAVDFFREHDEPFALWVSFPAPHEPYVVPQSALDAIDPELIELPPFDPAQLGRLPARSRFLYRMLSAQGRPAQLKHAVRAYLANAHFIDQQVGRIIDALEETGKRENTIVVFCADHGDFAGEMNMMVKGGTFHDALTRVPLLISWPGTVPSGERRREMVNLVDVVPTLFALADAEPPSGMAGHPLPGSGAKEAEASKIGGSRSETERAANEGCTFSYFRPNAVFSEYGAGMHLLPPEVEEQTLGEKSGMDAVMATLQWREAEGRRKMVRTPEWKYTHDTMDAVDELYDLRADPHERWNIAGDPQLSDIITQMRSLLCDWMIRTEDARAVELPHSPCHPGPESVGSHGVW